MTSVRWILLTGLVMWATTCGQKGPLSLPESAEPQNLLVQVQIQMQARAADRPVEAADEHA